MKNRAYCPAISVALSIVVAFAGSSMAALPAITLETTPSVLQLGPGEVAEVLVVARNPTEGVARAMVLSLFTDASVTADVSPPELAEMGPSGSCSWSLKVKKKEEYGPGAIHFSLNYQWVSEKASRPAPGLAVASLRLEERTPEKIEGIADVRVETSLEVLEENRPGTFFVVVKNLSPSPITVTSITTGVKPDFIILNIPDLGPDVTLGPRESRAFAIEARAGRAVQPGQYLLLFEVGIGRQERGKLIRGSVIAKHLLKVGVLGESDILKLLGVPSFLLLPGFLMVAAFMALWSRVHPRKAISIEVKSTEFWLIAITLSLTTAPVYPYVTGWLGNSRNYLVAYGLWDVFAVWIGSILAAVLAWIGVDGGIELRNRVREARYRRMTPDEKDAPLETLRKLAYRGMGSALKQVDRELSSGRKERFFLISSPAGRDAEVWIAPPIIYEWETAADTAFQQRFEAQLNREEDPAGMAALLEEGLRSNPKMLAVNWRSGGHPMKVPRSAVTIREDLPARRILQEGEE